MKVGKCVECERKKVYLEKDGKCVECLKEEGDPESTVLLKIDICELDHDMVRRSIEKAKSKRGFVRIQHRLGCELTGKPHCDLDIYNEEICFYRGPLEGKLYAYDDFEGRSKQEKLIKALTEAYSDILDYQFSD